ncbi:hypothetical protein E4U17_005182 [Claviceps sp. LM77 group G4]|nr:hypothetical protein E4U17_005182 [Claviceps sp. LM77 group G4]
MATPSTPVHPRDTDGAALYSRDTEPTSPFILQRSKRQRAANVAPVSIQLPGKVTGDDKTAQTYLGKQLDDLTRGFQVKKEVFTKLGRNLDDFVAGYRGDNQREHRASARLLVSMLLEHLNANVFNTNNVHDSISMPSTAPRMASQDANPPNRDGPGGKVSYAAIASRGAGATRSTASATTARATPPKPKAKEDIRVLVTLAEGAPRPEPYLMRHKLVTMLKGSPSDIQHVRRTPAGYAIQPATKLVRDRLVADELKKELGCAFAASKVSLPEKWYTYAVQDVPFSMKLGPAERCLSRPDKSRLAAGLRGTALTRLPVRELGWCRSFHLRPIDSLCSTAVALLIWCRRHLRLQSIRRAARDTAALDTAQGPLGVVTAVTPSMAIPRATAPSLQGALTAMAHLKLGTRGAPRLPSESTEKLNACPTTS